MALCLGLWATTDARRRQKPIPSSAQIWFFVFAWIMVPGYVIVTRGWKGIGWVVVHAVGWLMVATLAMLIVGLCLYGLDWL
ncbi:MAG: hypothetical protein AB7O68_07470 [Pirellulales bacterium]